MDKVDIIKRMRECNIKWKEIAYCLNLKVSTAQMAMKNKDIEELGEKPIIKRSKFDTGVILKLKQIAREHPELSIRDLQGALVKEMPGKAVPSITRIHEILNEKGFKMIKLLKKTLIFPRNQLKREEFCRQMANYGQVFWDTVIWSDETTVRQRPEDKDIIIRVHSSFVETAEKINPQIHSGGFSVTFWGCFSQLGLGPLVALEGTMSSSGYKNLLKDVVLPELAAAGRPMVFMQDNAPVTRSVS